MRSIHRHQVPAGLLQFPCYACPVLKIECNFINLFSLDNEIIVCMYMTNKLICLIIKFDLFYILCCMWTGWILYFSSDTTFYSAIHKWNIHFGNQDKKVVQQSIWLAVRGQRGHLLMRVYSQQFGPPRFCCHKK